MFFLWFMPSPIGICNLFYYTNEFCHGDRFYICCFVVLMFSVVRSFMSLIRSLLSMFRIFLFVFLLGRGFRSSLLNSFFYLFGLF